jgi:hypothetical protein
MIKEQDLTKTKIIEVTQEPEIPKYCSLHFLSTP